MADVLARPELSGALDGLVFRLTLDMSPWSPAATASAIATDLGVAASVHLRMFGANPALETADDYLSVSRIAEAMAAAADDNHIVLLCRLGATPGLLPVLVITQCISCE